MKKVVFTFGRMNPPTSGHQLLVNKLMAYAKMHSGIPRVYLSHSIGKKDPLPYDIKVSFARKAFGAIVRKSPAKNIIQILKDLEKEKFTDVTLVVGSDRVQEFKKLLNTYNGKEYQFDNINVVSAGERDPDADDVSGMSASKMRALVKDNNLSSFMGGAPSTLKAIDRKNLFNSVRKFMLGEDVMDYSHDERFVSFMIEAAADDDNISMPSNDEIERYLQSVSVEELDLADEDAFLYDVITGETESDDVQENRVLSVQARQKLSQRMKFMSKRLARLRQIKSKTMPAQQRLRMRSRKAALMILRRRATGKQNLDYSALSRSQRVAVDNALVNRFGSGLNTAVDRISKRILPSIRKKAQASVAQARDVKEQTIDPRTKKIVPNQKSDSPLSVDALKLDNLSIDPTQNDRAAPNPEKSHLHKNRKLSHKVIFDEGRKSSTGQDGRDAGDTNIIYQMRKTINSRGEHETEFTDGHKMHISIADAKKLLARYETLRLPNDKLRFTVMAASSMKNFKDILAHGLPKEQKKKISLGGKKISEFYLGVGRNRTASPYDGDEPPGTRRVAEAAKDEDRPEDPNRSRPLSQKLDLLLRLGIADSGDLQKYRRALRSSKKQALQSPEMREKLVDLLDKLIDLTTQDPATYSRVRYRVMTKEAMSLLNKAEASGIDISILGEVFARGYKNNENINEAFNRVNSFIAGGKAAEMDKDLSEAIENKKGKIYKDGKWIGTVRHRGDSFNSHRTHPTKKLSVVKSHKTRADAEKHIIKSHEMGEAVKEPTGGLKDACWKGYTAVGMKMKNGRSVPNCVPKESSDCRCEGDCKCVKEVQRTADIKMIKVRMPDGTIKFRKEKATTSVQNESYTGSEATSSNKNDPSNRFVGTDAIRKNYASATPGQEQVAGEISVAAFSPEKQSYISPGVRRASNEVDQSKQNAGQKTLKSFREALSGIRESNDLNEAFSAGFELAPLARDYGIRVQSAFEHHPQVQEALDAQKLVANETVEEDKKGHKSPSGGLTQKGRDYYNRQSGGNLKAPVTTEPSKLKKGSKAANRRKSFCARMGGMKKRLTSAKTANDPDSRINKALRKWNC